MKNSLGFQQLREAEELKAPFPYAKTQERRPGAATLTDGEMDETAEFQSSLARLDQSDNSFKAEHYRSKLASCPASGSGERRVHRWVLSTANLAQRAKVDFADWSEDVIQNATRAVSRTELVEAWAKAGGGGGLGTELFSRHPEIKHAPLSAAEFIKRGFGATEADLLAASPVRIDGVVDRRLSASALLRAVSLPGELVYCGFTTGGAVLERDDWISRFMAGEYIPPLFCANPLKAGGGLTANGVRSPRCDDAVAVFRHAVAEMDSMPLADQVHLWNGWGLDSVSAITFSGAKSLHVLLRVDVADRQEWDRNVRNGLFRKRLIPLGCDRACVNPSRLTRLAGACRPDKNETVQKLLFVREELHEYSA